MDPARFRSRDDLIRSVRKMKLAEALRPGLTIPCHYGMFASHGGDPGRFIELMKETGLKTLLMTPGEKYTL